MNKPKYKQILEAFTPEQLKYISLDGHMYIIDIRYPGSDLIYLQFTITYHNKPVDSVIAAIREFLDLFQYVDTFIKNRERLFDSLTTKL